MHVNNAAPKWTYDEERDKKTWWQQRTERKTRTMIHIVVLCAFSLQEMRVKLQIIFEGARSQNVGRLKLFLAQKKEANVHETSESES